MAIAQESMAMNLDKFLMEENGKSGIAVLKAPLCPEDYSLPFKQYSTTYLNDVSHRRLILNIESPHDDGSINNLVMGICIPGSQTHFYPSQLKVHLQVSLGIF